MVAKCSRKPTIGAEPRLSEVLPMMLLIHCFQCLSGWNGPVSSFYKVHLRPLPFSTPSLSLKALSAIGTLISSSSALRRHSARRSMVECPCQGQIDRSLLFNAQSTAKVISGRPLAKESIEEDVIVRDSHHGGTFISASAAREGLNCAFSEM